MKHKFEVDWQTLFIKHFRECKSKLMELNFFKNKIIDDTISS